MKTYSFVTLFLACSIASAQDVNDWVKYSNYPKTGIYTTTIASLLAKPVMMSKQEGCRVLSFDMFGEVHKTKKEVGPVSSDGAHISAAQKTLIKKVGEKGTIWIYNVKLQCNDGTTHRFGKEKGSFAVYYFRIKDKK